MESRCPACGKDLPSGLPASARELRVANVMTRDPLTLSPEDSLMHAVEVMRLHGIRRLPVVLGGQLVGLLAEGDLKRAQPSTLSATEQEFNEIMEGTQVSRIMINSPITVEESLPLEEAARTLASTKFGALPVLREGRLVGILTDNDLIRCLAEMLRPPG